LDAVRAPVPNDITGKEEPTMKKKPAAKKKKK